MESASNHLLPHSDEILSTASCRTDVDRAPVKVIPLIADVGPNLQESSLVRSGLVMPSTVAETRREIDTLRRERDKLIAHTRSLERQNDQYRESFLRKERAIHEAVVEVIALRTSTSWRITQPLRFLSKAWSAFLKGPVYWGHLYVVREGVRANWRRENPIVAAGVIEPQAQTPVESSRVIPAHASSADAITAEMTLAVPPSGNARVRDSLMRANLSGLPLR